MAKPSPGSWRLPMRRVISLYLPTFATDRLRRERPPDAPPEALLVTATRDGQRRILAAADANSRAIGLNAGMTVTHARALVPDLVLAEAEPERDAGALGLPGGRGHRRHDRRRPWAGALCRAARGAAGGPGAPGDGAAAARGAAP